jgi:hypothetical protein
MFRTTGEKEKWSAKVSDSKVLVREWVHASVWVAARLVASL